MNDPMFRAQSILNEVFGFERFWPLQEKIIAHLLLKKDALVVMPTGGGKSLCYQVPGMLFEGLTVVVSPLISLMKDQVDQLKEYGVPALVLNSTLSVTDYRKNVTKLRENQVKLLYLAPEALLAPRTLALLADLKVDCLAVDEAHCISQWGHDFRPEYRQLAEVRAALSHASCVALTATATPRVREDIRRCLKIDGQGEFIGSFNRPNLFLEVVPKEKPLDQVLDVLERYPNESGIIYCATRRQTEELQAALQRHGYTACPYHAGLSDEERTGNQERFRRDDIRIIVATIAFGMGINKPNIRFVIHYDLPGSIDNYYQEIGRAGRDGLKSHCLLLFSYGDLQKIQYFIGKKIEGEQRVANILLSQLLGFAETDLCRRVPLLHYFGETDVPDRCGMCDNCRMTKEEKELVDLTIPAQMFLSCVRRTSEIFGAGHIIDVLRGSNSQKILKFGHEELSTYGIGKAYSAKQWRHFARQLIQKGLLLYQYEHGSLKLTPKAWEVLHGREPFLGKMEEAHKEPGAVQKPQGNDGETFDPELFEILRKKRKELADEANLPPYAIFHDRTLREMALHYPQTRESLVALYGIGQRKLEKYADAFLEIIGEYCQTHRIPAAPNPIPTPEPAHATALLENNAKREYQDRFRPGDETTFVCLATSRKYGGYCIAGKEWEQGKVGPWLRPVSRQENGELSAAEIALDNGHTPQCLDVITIETLGAQDHPYQKENVWIAEGGSWSWRCKFPLDALPHLVDDVDDLWQNGSNSANGVNNRVPVEEVEKGTESSLYLIRPDDFTLVVSDDLDGRKKVRARFTYCKTPYLISVTDPRIERIYLMRKQGEYPLHAEDLYLTVSLGGPFNGYCYKLAAAVIIGSINV